MNPAPSELQLRTSVARLMRHYPEVHLFGFCCGSGYSGATQFDIEGRPMEVVEVRSPLHFHQLAWQSDLDGRARICLCPHRDWVDQDLRDRMARRDLLDSDPWEAVQDLFRAHHVDVQLRRERQLAHWALESQPPQGYPAALGGVLTGDLFWGCLLEARLGLTIDAYDPSQLLLQAADQGAEAPLLAAPQALVERAGEWLAQRGGELTRELLLLLRRQGVLEGLALGVLCEVLYLGPQLPEKLVARGRLESFFPDRPWPEAHGRAFGELMQQLAGSADGSPEWLPEVLERARLLLAQLKAEELSQHSLLLPQGWDARLEALGRALSRDDGARVDALLNEVRLHRLTHLEPRQLSRLEMAMRLRRYLVRPHDPEPSVQAYLDELAWVDRARQHLLEGAPQPTLAQAYQALLQQLALRRELWNEAFAQRVVCADPEVIYVEHFLDRVAVPLAQEARLLILVLDGCSQAALLDLLASLEERDWVCYLPEDPQQGRLVSALPSVTEVARSSLLAGKLTQGAAAGEKEAHTRHPGLRATCRKDHPPQLYHKKDLSGSVVYERLRSEEYRVVTVVVNAIDDTLARDEQLQLNWSAELIAPLEGLLQAARYRGRLVLLVSDHGHLLDHATRELPAPAGAGNRWQPGNQPQPGALVVNGGRLQLAEEARLLWSEGLRWGPKKRGYHGGLSPQEMVCALALLGPPGQNVQGWREGRRPAPAWWDPLPRAPFVPPTTGGTLFDLEAMRPLDELLADSPVWQSRSQSLPLPARLQPLMRLLGNAQRVSLDQLGSELAMSRPQVRNSLSGWIRWLNVEGEPVLSLRGEQLQLDREALRRAFGV